MGSIQRSSWGQRWGGPKLVRVVKASLSNTVYRERRLGQIFSGQVPLRQSRSHECQARYFNPRPKAWLYNGSQRHADDGHSRVSFALRVVAHFAFRKNPENSSGSLIPQRFSAFCRSAASNQAIDRESGLISYGPDLVSQLRPAADYVDRIRSRLCMLAPNILASPYLRNDFVEWQTETFEVPPIGSLYAVAGRLQATPVLSEVVGTSILKTGRFPRYPRSLICG